MPDRLGAWRAVLARVRRREATPDGVRLRFPADPDLVASLAGLALLEVECCPFFTFRLTMQSGETCLAVSAPPDAQTIVAELFG